MVKFNYITGTIAIIAGILCALLFNKNIYAVIGSAAGILYGIALIFQASYFERLETITAEARANTKLILDYLNHQTEPQAPTQAAPDPLTAWKRQE